MRWLLLTLIGTTLFAEGGDNADKLDEPWFTAPLIAPYGIVVPRGDFLIEPYLYFATNTGTYNSHWKNESNPNFFTFNPELWIWVGLTPWMDINVIPQLVTNVTEGQNDTRIGDFIVALDFQLYPYTFGNPYPGWKFTLQETFPTGHYENLNPNLLGTDSSGTGTFGTTALLVLYNVYHLWGQHYLSVNASWGYTYNTSVHVSGSNTYGGGLGTKGTVHVGNSWTGILSFEFSMSRHWALALDNVYTHTDSSPFTGTTDDSMFNPSSEVFGMAPAIEYNFNANYGIIAGCYFSAVGRNTPVFRDGVIAFNAYF